MRAKNHRFDELYCPMREAASPEVTREARRTHPCSQTAVILLVTVPLLESGARAVVFLLHEPVIDPLSRQAGIDYKTVA